jgi:hypothetical protein
MNLECTFKFFLVIVGSLRFQWAQAPLLITLGFEPEQPLIKKGKQTEYLNNFKWSL